MYKYLPPRQNLILKRYKHNGFKSIIDKLKLFGPRDILNISAEIPEDSYFPNEILNSNSYYGHSSIIKDFCGLDENYILKLSIQHGMYFGKTFFEPEAKTFKNYLVWGDSVKSNLKQVIDNKMTTIGSPFFYSKNFLTNTQIKKEKNRLGKNILVFPAHSTHNSELKFDIDEFISSILQKYATTYKIRVCLYWKDCTQENLSIYEKYGIECVTAGHIFDPMFYPRLKSLLEVSDVTASNDIGSFLGYSIYMKKPHQIFKSKLSVLGDVGGFRSKVYNEFRQDVNYNKLYQLLSECDLEISKEIYDICDKYFGFSNIKSSNVLKKIILDCESNYNESFTRKYFFYNLNE